MSPDVKQTFTLVVNQPPAITGRAHVIIGLGKPASVIVSTSGYPAPVLSLSGKLPAGLTFDPATATFSGTPTVLGSFALTLTANNSIGPKARQDLTLSVYSVTVFTTSDTVTFTAGVPQSFTVRTSGFPAATITETGALPDGVTVVDNHDGTATLAGTPSPSSGGVYRLTVAASNGFADPGQSFTLTIDAATAITSPDTTVFAIGSLGRFKINGTGYPAPTLTVTGTLPAGITFHPMNHTLAGTPGIRTEGTYRLVITASGSTAAVQNFTLVVVGRALTIPPSSTPPTTASPTRSLTTTSPSTSLTTSPSLTTGPTSSPGAPGGSATASAASLADTGVAVTELVGCGALLLSAGLALVLACRRRRSRNPLTPLR